MRLSGSQLNELVHFSNGILILATATNQQDQGVSLIHRMITFHGLATTAGREFNNLRVTPQVNRLMPDGSIVQGRIHGSRDIAFGMFRCKK
jgi:hypothetical protein